MTPKKRTKEMIGASAPKPCDGCGCDIKGEGWVITSFPWGEGYVDVVLHAFSEPCYAAIQDRWQAAMAREAA